MPSTPHGTFLCRPVRRLRSDRDFTIIGAVGALLAAVLAAVPLWPRQPFRLDRVNPDVVVLVRTRWPSVVIRTVWVFGHRTLVTRDAAATPDFRQLDTGGELFLDVSGLQPGETVIVEWRRLRRRDRKARSRAPQTVDAGRVEGIGRSWSLRGLEHLSAVARALAVPSPKQA